MLLIALAIVIIATLDTLRRVEASMAAFFLGVTHIAVGAQAIGTAVYFPQNHRWIGIDLTPGCAAALLIVPFVLLTGIILVSGRLRPTRALMTLGAVVAIVAVTNQARLAAIGGAMELWGLQTGYARGHILIGTLLSTVGVTLGVVAFLFALTRSPTDRPRLPRRRIRHEDRS